jgi:hypothetical protein
MHWVEQIMNSIKYGSKLHDLKEAHRIELSRQAQPRGFSSGPERITSPAPRVPLATFATRGTTAFQAKGHGFARKKEESRTSVLMQSTSTMLWRAKDTSASLP